MELTSDPEHGNYQSISLKTTSPRWNGSTMVVESLQVIPRPRGEGYVRYGDKGGEVGQNRYGGGRE